MWSSKTKTQRAATGVAADPAGGLLGGKPSKASETLGSGGRRIQRGLAERRCREEPSAGRSGCFACPNRAATKQSPAHAPVDCKRESPAPLKIKTTRAAWRYLVDPASSHMLVSKIKPCMSKYKLLYTVKLRMAH